MGKMPPYKYTQVEKATASLLNAIGEDINREGLQHTPRRVAAAWLEMTEGYLHDPEKILDAVFTESTTSMVALENCTGWSTCEHHLMPFSYVAHVAYIPNDKVVGISKLARLVECFGKRLQIQERMCEQIADSIMEHLAPKGCMVIIKGQHLCMKARGVKNSTSVMTTSAIRGVFSEPEIRGEFLSLIALK